MYTVENEVELQTLPCSTLFVHQGHIHMVTNSHANLPENAWPSVNLDTGELYWLHKLTKVEIIKSALIGRTDDD